MPTGINGLRQCFVPFQYPINHKYFLFLLAWVWGYILFDNISPLLAMVPNHCTKSLCQKCVPIVPNNWAKSLYQLCQIIVSSLPELKQLNEIIVSMVSIIVPLCADLLSENPVERAHVALTWMGFHFFFRSKWNV